MVDVNAVDLSSPIRIVTGRVGHLRILKATEPMAGCELSLHDAAGQLVQMTEQQAQSSRHRPSWNQSHEVSPLFTVSERAVEVVYHRAGVPDRNVPLRVIPGEITEIGW